MRQNLIFTKHIHLLGSQTQVWECFGTHSDDLKDMTAWKNTGAAMCWLPTASPELIQKQRCHKHMLFYYPIIYYLIKN